jgi:hypothetical protein
MTNTNDTRGVIDGNEATTVAKARDRLAGRRATAIEQAAKACIVATGTAQNRHVRRNNLRLARLEVKARRKAVANGETVMITDADGAVRFEPVTDEHLRAMNLSNAETAHR